MGNLGDTATLYKREMLIFKSHLRTNIIRSIIFPLIIIGVFGNLGASAFGIKVAVVNYAGNPSSLSFINSLQSNQLAYIETITGQSEALKLLSDGKVTAVVVILPSFPEQSNGNPPVKIYYSNLDVASSGAVVPFLQSKAESFGSAASTAQKSAQQPQGSVSISPLYGTTSNYKVFIMGGIFAMVAGFGTIFGSGMSIITDKQLGNMKSFLISPINNISIVMSKILAGFTQTLLYVILALMIGLLFGASVAMGPVGILWIIVLGGMIGLGFAGITVILASRIEKVEVYTILAQVLVLPMWFLSGAFFPTTGLPSFLQPFVAANPMTYATNGIRDVMMIGYFPATHILLDMGVLGAFVVVGIALSLVFFKSYVD